MEANAKVMGNHPELFARPGGQGKYTIGVWFSFMILWFFCDPMFPQLFQRFFSAREERSISGTMLLYPLVCTLVFFLPVAVGVLGRAAFPDLVGKEADRILPMVLTHISGGFMASLVMAAGLAALMSTMDSQLLTLSSIFTRDVMGLFRKNQPAGALSGRLFVVFLTLAGVLLALKPPATILQIATQTFSGLAVLFPTVFFGLYLKKVYPVSALLSIIIGEALLSLFYFKVLTVSGFLPVIPVMVVTVGVYLITHGIYRFREKKLRFRIPEGLLDPYLPVFMIIFLAGMDFWAWNRTEPLMFGVPAWIGYFVLLSGIQTAVMVFWIKRKESLSQASGFPARTSISTES